MYRTRRFGNYGSKQLKPDLTPLIDVVFLLLIFFMVATTFEDVGGMKIELPKADIVKQDIELDKTITLLVDRDKVMKLKIETKSSSDIVDITSENLVATIEKEVANMKEKSVAIKADRELGYGEIVDIMASLKEAGAASIDIETSKK